MYCILYNLSVSPSPSFICFLTGIVFDNLDGNDLVYTLRLRHEVGEEDTWKTNENAFWFQHPGARVTNK